MQTPLNEQSQDGQVRHITHLVLYTSPEKRVCKDVGRFLS